MWHIRYIRGRWGFKARRGIGDIRVFHIGPFIVHNRRW